MKTEWKCHAHINNKKIEDGTKIIEYMQVSNQDFISKPDGRIDLVNFQTYSFCSEDEENKHENIDKIKQTFFIYKWNIEISL